MSTPALHSVGMHVAHLFGLLWRRRPPGGGSLAAKVEESIERLQRMEEGLRLLLESELARQRLALQQEAPVGSGTLPLLPVVGRGG